MSKYTWSGDTYYKDRDYYNVDTGLVVGSISDHVISSKHKAFVYYPLESYMETKNLGTYMNSTFARKAVELWVEKNYDDNGELKTTTPGFL